MSTTMDDVLRNMAMEEQYLEELYDKHIDEFTDDMLKSYFLSHPQITLSAVKAFETAKSLLSNKYFTPALIYAAIVQEFTVKNILLTAIVHGLINNEIASDLITKFAIGHGSPSKFKEMIIQLLDTHGGINLSTYKRSGVTKTLWEEMTQIILGRNEAVHKAKILTEAEAKLSIDVANEILYVIFPSVIAKLGLRLQNNEIVPL